MNSLISIPCLSLEYSNSHLAKFAVKIQIYTKSCFWYQFYRNRKWNVIGMYCNPQCRLSLTYSINSQTVVCAWIKKKGGNQKLSLNLNFEFKWDLLNISCFNSFGTEGTNIETSSTKKDKSKVWSFDIVKVNVKCNLSKHHVHKYFVRTFLSVHF